MGFKIGRFYAIQAKTISGNTIYLEGSPDDHPNRLRRIAKKAASGYSWSEDSYNDDDILTSDNPFGLKLYDIDSNVDDLVSTMRYLRTFGSSICDINSIKLVIVDTSVTSFVPDADSDDAIALRKFALEKLSSEERDLLNLSNWEVYNKLADRTGLSDDDIPF